MKQEKAPRAAVLGDAPTRAIYIWCHAKTPSCNEWNNKKHHQWIYAGIRKQWKARLAIALRQVKGIQFQKIKIEVHRYSATRKLDEANAADGLKPIVDALGTRNAGLGIIKDDSPAHMPEAPTVKQAKALNKNLERSLIVIKELED